jgi:hypothetical protein
MEISFNLIRQPIDPDKNIFNEDHCYETILIAKPKNLHI